MQQRLWTVTRSDLQDSGGSLVKRVALGIRPRLAVSSLTSVIDHLVFGVGRRGRQDEALVGLVAVLCDARRVSSRVAVYFNGCFRAVASLSAAAGPGSGSTGMRRSA